MRKENRFNLQTAGQLKRITDVKPNERVEYTVTIQDVSRSGMKIVVSQSFIPSKLVYITFPGPSGKMKSCFLEIVRMKKISEENPPKIEIGCRSVKDEDAKKIIEKEKETQNIRNKLAHRAEIRVLVVSPSMSETTDLAAFIRKEGYQIHKLTSMQQVQKESQIGGTQVAVFMQTNRICNTPDILQRFENLPPNLAKVVILNDDADRLTLLNAGADECIPAAQTNELIFHAIERAIIGNATRLKEQANLKPQKILIASSDRIKINFLSYQLEESMFEWDAEMEYDGLKQGQPEKYELIFADFNPDNPKRFLNFRNHFPDVPVIALCDMIADGNLAMAHNATNYLCMPIRANELKLIIESLIVSPINS